MRRDRRVTRGVLLCCLAVALLAAVAGVAAGGVGVVAGGVDDPLQSVQENASGQPPELAGGERINDTAILLTFTDDTGVDVDSIGTDDFLLSAGELAGVSASASGPDAAVELSLAEPVNAPEVTVAVRGGSDIRDVDGNTINASEFVGVTVEGMDGVAPELRRMDVPDRTSGTAELTFVFEEAVEEFHASLTGPRNATFDRDDFEKVGDFQYTLTYELPTDGVYTVELHNATDEAGNTATFGRATSMEVRSADVRAVAGVDFAASEGLTLTFDASQSDDAAVAYLWDFGDGETATGERVTHEFAPGNYTVQLEVIDEFGNTGRDELVLSLTGNSTTVTPGDGSDGTPAVRIDRSGTPRPSRAHVSIAGVTAGEAIQVGGDGLTNEPLVATEAFSLDRIRLTPASERPIGIGLTAAGRESALASDARSGTDGEPIGGFVARPTVPDEAFSAITVRFSVTADELRRLGTSASSVGLYREQDGSWERVPTTVGSLTDTGASFESELSGFSRFAILSTPPEQEGNSGSDSEGESSSSDDSDADNGGQTGTDDGSRPAGNSTGDGESTGNASGPGQFRVTNVTLSETSIEPGESVDIRAKIVNQGEQPGTYVAALEVNGTVVQTQEVVRIPPGGEDLPVMFTQPINETGTVQISINGTAAPELTVGEGGGGGGLFSFLGILSFLPLPIGLLWTVLKFVVGPLLVIYLALKVVAVLR